MNKSETENIAVNFRAPDHLVNSFDKVCKVEGMNRTQMLKWLMKSFIRENSDKVRSFKNQKRSTTKLGNTIEERKAFFNYGETYWDDRRDILGL